MSEQGLGDPRGPRTAAGLTAVVLAVVLVTRSPLLLALQAVVFGLGTSGSSPYDAVFRRVVQPRLRPVAPEPTAPARFAQLAALVLATVGTFGLLAGVEGLATAAVAAALASAVLNAALGLCLGCELYLLVRRTTTRKHRPATGEGATA